MQRVTSLSSSIRRKPKNKSESSINSYLLEEACNKLLVLLLVLFTGFFEVLQNLIYIHGTNIKYNVLQNQCLKGFATCWEF